MLSALPAQAWQAEVERVVDGDTVYLTADGERVKVRLYGIDCPERKQAGGFGATAYVRENLPHVVEVEEVAKDRYGRTVAIIYVNGQPFNREVVAAGWAWVYGRYCKKDFCADWVADEEQARQRGEGLWAAPSPVPPWTWRRR